MKKIYLIISLMILLVTSCSDFLDTYPKDALSPSTTWQNEDDAEKFLVGLYNGWIWGEEFFYLDCASDIGFNFHTHEGWRQIGNGTLTAANPGNSFYNFSTIRRVITFLENIDNVPFSDEADKLDMIGQAKTIRAYNYFKMNFWYGGVPIIDSYVDAEEAKVPRNSETEVKEYVYKEIDEAIGYLKVRPNSDKGRVGKATALAVKMRSALYWGDYQRALDAARAIIDLNVYELDSDYTNQFTLAGQNSPEIILSNQRIKNLASEWIVTIPNNADGGWSSMVPTQNLIDLYEMENGLTKEEAGSGYDPAHPFAGRDPRMAMTVLYPGREWESGYNDVLNTLDRLLPDGSPNANFPEGANNASKTALTWSKYVVPLEQYERDFYTTNTQYIVFRYAEVLLTLAEAANELTGPSEEVYNALNEIRNRVGMPDVDRTKYNTKETLRELIRRERSVELAGEGFRRADIVRWKDASGKMIAETVLNKPLTRIEGTVDYNEPDPFKRATVTGTVIIEDRKFTPNNRYLPIPQGNIDNNPALVQNQGY
jgi:hypothetical protein